MIKSFKVTNYLGDSIKLILREPERTGFLVSKVDGLGPSKANIITTDISTNDGSRYNTARLDKRNIVMTLLFVDNIRHESVEDLRQKSYKYFPIKKNVELVIETDNRLLKATGYVESNEPNIFSSQEGTQISIVCPDPYLYSAGENNETIFYSVDPMLEFPFSNESLSEPLLVMGNIHLITEGVVVYKGDAEVGITIRIHANGPAVNLSVYNIETKEKMAIDSSKLEALTGSGIIAKDDIIITTMKGNKTITLIRDGVSYNILNCLGKNVDWFTLTKGDNLFGFTADEGITNLQFRIENKVVYEGV